MPICFTQEKMKFYRAPGNRTTMRVYSKVYSDPKYMHTVNRVMHLCDFIDSQKIESQINKKKTNENRMDFILN